MNATVAALRLLISTSLRSRWRSRRRLLSRLVFNQGKLGLTRSESSLLATLRGGPQRITALAELEGLAQPATVTVLVKRLEQRGMGRPRASRR